MKRLLFIAVAGVLFSSCTKEYRCNCVATTRGTGQTVTTEFPMAVSRKGDANNKCIQYQNQYNAQFSTGAGNSRDYTCTVK